MDLFEVATPKLPVDGADDRFPVHRIYCIGRNYADHVREMGGEPDRAPPVYFLKPADSIVPGGGEVRYPPRTESLHHEIELVVAIGRGGENVSTDAAEQHIFGYAVGIDLTRRDLQAAAKDTAGPWDTAKSFEQAAPISALRPAESIGHPVSGRIWLEHNGSMRQEADLSDMIWSIREAIADLSTLFTLAPGDLLFTGTPAGVGAVAKGDTLSGGVEGVGELEITMV